MIYKSRIIIYDAEKHDRALLTLALRSAIATIEVLEASTPVEIAHHLSTGVVDAVVADPGDQFQAICTIVGDIRKRNPTCALWLFAQQQLLPAPRVCIGLGIDGRTAKTSAGFLQLPLDLLEGLRFANEFKSKLGAEQNAIFSGTYPGASVVLARDGTVLAASRELEELLEQPRFDLIGRPLDQFWAESAKRDEWRRRLLATNQSFEFSGRIRLAAARIATVAVALKPLQSPQSQDLLWTANIIDITNVLGGMTTVESQSNDRELERVLYAVTHDLQAPLNSLASHTRWLVDAVSNDPENVRSTVAEVQALTARMQQMLDGMVQVSLAQGSNALPEAVNLDSVIVDAIANLRGDIDESAATIERQPMPTLVVNRQQMVQVFQNLLGNAIKFRSNRIPRIRISAEENGDSLRILVEDNGIGIDPKDSAKIFGMFQRLHSEREYPGIGAGLAICRQIVRGHGGELTVESTPGRGSCFIIEFRGAALRTVINGAAASGAVN